MVYALRNDITKFLVFSIKYQLHLFESLIDFNNQIKEFFFNLQLY